MSMDLYAKLGQRWKEERTLIEDQLALVIQRGVRAHGWLWRFETQPPDGSLTDLPPGVENRDLPWVSIEEIFKHKISWWIRAGVLSSNALAAWVIDESGVMLDNSIGDWLVEIAAEQPDPAEKKWSNRELAKLWNKTGNGLQQRELWRTDLLQTMSSWSWQEIVEAAMRAKKRNLKAELPAAMDLTEGLVADARELVSSIESNLLGEAVITLISTRTPLVSFVKQEVQAGQACCQWGPPVHIPENLTCDAVWRVPADQLWWRYLMLERLMESWSKMALVVVRTRPMGQTEEPWRIMGWELDSERKAGLNSVRMRKEALADRWQHMREKDIPLGQENVVFLD